MHCLYWGTLDPYPHLTKLLSKLKPMPNSVLLQDHTMLFSPAYKVLIPCVALFLTWLVSTLSASRPDIELRVRIRSAKAFRRSKQLERVYLLLSLRSAPSGTRNFLLLPWLVALRKRSMWYVVWTATANLMIFHRTRNRRLPQPWSATNQRGRILLDRSPYGPPRYQSLSNCGHPAPHETCVACFSLVLG